MLILAKLVETSAVRFKWDIIESSFIIVVATISTLALVGEGVVHAKHACGLTIRLDHSIGTWSIHLVDVEVLHVVLIRRSSSVRSSRTGETSQIA